MPGVYLHIPFCRKACSYCDFHFSTNLGRKEQMVTAIRQELELRHSFFAEKAPLQSVYFGGGTPSVLTPAEVAGLIQTTESLWGVAADAEITLESNPDDLSVEYVAGLKRAGINRISIGVQSFHAEDLQGMNRSHNADQALKALDICREAGIDNVTMDLIFGLPGSDLAGWRDNLTQLIALRPTHASIYSLTIEEKTALAHQIRKGTVSVPEDEMYESQFRLAHELMTEAGYEHYELSNYALPGYRAQHNGSYWAGEPYIGVGPSAHSFDGNKRSWNVANNQKYLNSISSGSDASEGEEELSLTDRYHEYVMLGLRTDKGIDVEFIQRSFFPNWKNEFWSIVQEWLTSGQLRQHGSVLTLSPEGWFLSDRIASDFFVEE